MLFMIISARRTNTLSRPSRYHHQDGGLAFAPVKQDEIVVDLIKDSFIIIYYIAIIPNYPGHPRVLVWSPSHRSPPPPPPLEARPRSRFRHCFANENRYPAFNPRFNTLRFTILLFNFNIEYYLNRLFVAAVNILYYYYLGINNIH